MNGKDLLIGLGSISPKYYDEAENDTIVSETRHMSFKRPLLVAAIIALAALLVGCGAFRCCDSRSHLRRDGQI